MRKAKIYVAGHTGLVGSSLLSALGRKGYTNIVTRTHEELDLTNQRAVSEFFSSEKPDYVYLAAARVGGILANDTLRADFIYDNLMIQSNVIHNAYMHRVKRLLFLGSTCIYPKDAPQPLKEEYLLTGPLEPTNEPYSIAKIAGVKMCEAYNSQHGTDFISVMPPNIYGPGDNFDKNNSHVLAAIITKMTEGADSVTLWGTGKPMREFMFSDDLAEACIFIMEHDSPPHFLNIGTGEEVSINELALKVKSITGYKGRIYYDGSKPDGMMRKLSDITALRQMGYKHKISLDEGIKLTLR